MKYTDDSLEWHDENELIRKLDAVEAVLNMADSLEEVVDILMTVPSVDAGANEWCEDCKEYDKEHHNCPRFNRVIRTALEDADMVRVVRCKECKHWIGETEHYEDREYKACWQLCGQYMNSEFWCKYGEREGE